MSWNIFSRLTSPKKAPPVITKEEEKAFEREVNKISVLDEATKKLYKDMKHCIEAMGALSKSQCRIGQNLAASPILNTEESLKNLELISKSIGQIESKTQELNASSMRTMVEPMKKFSTIFPSLYMALKKREQCLQEYSRCQGKVEKYQDRERTGPNLAKLEASKKNLAAAKEEYDRQHTELMQAMPQFFEGRVEYFQPSFEALIKSQVIYYTECFKIYAELAVQLGDNDTLQSDEDFEMDLHRRLCEIRALSIVVDD
ncbi:bridging integrator 3-like [Acanthaster planci]|uniref:Bridging integrator 3-like n=1 Tax=Acanthaster planci TaxID=133434 RepID=A0A8B7Y033_ACAPL|nr:bridging integrator 3-like [Acanthaster planci]XP_022086513.1 bridging integrator 3-like [Acanthaster planci]XP_022086514.1 bridging integrator 3-like [Acanthaster planci]XP_022086515.1 bridging integrator 3-like [Acanthaster planci]